MNEESTYINVYTTISSNKMYAYRDWIAKICFGVKPDINKVYSFTSNPINGHFSFKIHNTYNFSLSTPQDENEARQTINKLITELKSKITKAHQDYTSFPKDFPTLFNSQHIN